MNAAELAINFVFVAVPTVAGLVLAVVVYEAVHPRGGGRG